MPEWSNGVVSKTTVSSQGPQVRILLLPPKIIRRKTIMHYVYILLSLKDKKFYIGYSADLKRRIIEHKNGKVTSTKFRRPLKLICYEAYCFKPEAQTREKFLKSSDGKKDLRKRLTMSLCS